MMQHEDAKHLVDYARTQLEEIEKQYEKSLRDQNIEKSLLIGIKGFMENLRSALDYVAHGIFDSLGHSDGKNRRVYFPYAPRSESLEEFRAKNRVRSSIPGLEDQAIIEKLESFQHFTGPDKEWLPKFMDLNNKNKHQALTPQVRKETRQLDIKSGGTGIRLGGGAQIRLGKGASIRMGGSVITGGQTISSDKPANIIGPSEQTITTWVSFNFEDNGESVVPFLRKCLAGVENIVDELAADD